MSRSTRILVIGAGAAGSAAIRELAQHEEISPTAIIETEVAPYNRTLINKAVATGLLDAYQAHLPALPVPSIRDSVHAVDPLEQTLRLRSGARLDYDALIVATGSAPHSLPPNTTSPAALDSGRVTHLHSLDDALRVRAVLERTRSPRVLIYGAGMIGAETAGILRDAGCRVTLAASSPIPGVSAFGSQVAGQLSQAHRVTVDTHFGHALTRLDLVESELHAAFTDGRVIAADLAVSALGTRPLSPSPWGGAIAVDSRLRSRDHENVYAAGGVAVHETDGTTWRIDHWSDAEAQGAHAARSVLSSLGHADAPEPYRPCALYSAQIHQHLYVAAGHTGRFGTTRALSTSPLVLTHGRAGRLVGVSGLDAGPDVMALVPRLHTSITPMLTAESNPSTDTPLGYMVECMNAGNPPHRHDHGEPGMQHSHPSPTPHGAHTGIAEHDAPEAHHDHGTHGDHEDHSGHEGHSGHGGHAGHGDHVGQFRRLFWINLILAVPVVAFSPMFAMLLGYSVPEFPGALWIAPVLGTVMYIWGGRPFLTGAVSEIRSRQPGMMLLIGLAITVAFIASWGATLGILDHQLDFWWELALLIVIMLLGHWVEMRSLAQTTSALDSLAALLPDMAERIEDDELVSISPNELQRGDLILVRPGASVPADGTIREGRADVDESMVTGESRPVTRSTGDSVVAGTVATDSSLRIEVTATGDDTALAGIQRLVTEAQNSSSRAQRIADTAAAWLFWFALGAAVITAITWSLLGMPDDAVVRTVTVLVIACPHALGLAIPLVVSIATERAARGGVLVKDRLALEAMRSVDAVLFDKTGTLTKGEPVLAEIITRGADETEVLALAAAAEAESEHPLARAIVAKAQAEGAQIPAGSDVSSTPALGVSAQVDGHEIRVGGPRLLEETGVSEVEEAEAWRQEGAIILHVLRDGEVIGGFKLTDEVRPESRDAIDALHSLGVEVVMITGDAEAVANSVGRELGIDRVFAGVRPEDKSSKVAQLQKEGKKVAMVGDGVNDAPALAQADVGIAIGAGTDVAIASAGVVLASSDPRSVLSVIELSRAAYRKMKQNLWWAAGYNLISVPLAAGILAPIGFVLPMSVGAILMSLSTIVVALNAQLLRRLDLRPEATVAAVRARH